jgi:hypothetical protein
MRDMPIIRIAQSLRITVSLRIHPIDGWGARGGCYMFVLRGYGRLLLVAAPIGVLVAALTGLLLASGGGKSKDRSNPAREHRQANAPQPPSLGAVHRVAQATTSSPGGDARGAALPGPSAAQPVLRIYRCQPGSEGLVAARLQEEFGRYLNVRVVPDVRTSQILVMAPPDVQSEIANRLPVEQFAGGSARSTPPASPPSLRAAGSPALAHNRRPVRGGVGPNAGRPTDAGRRRPA